MNWQPDLLLEGFLQPGATGAEHQWQQVKEYLSSSFAAYLGADIEPVWEPIYEDISPNYGFAFGICSRVALGGPVALEWYCVLSTKGSGHTDATMLLFAQDERVVHTAGRGYLSFEFVPAETGFRRWLNRGWHTDEYGEWEGYQRLSEIRRRREEKGATKSQGTSGDNS